MPGGRGRLLKMSQVSRHADTKPAVRSSIMKISIIPERDDCGLIP